jgi:hypothetical protein
LRFFRMGQRVPLRDGDVVMTATCAALVKDTWSTEGPDPDGAYRLKGLVVPGLESAQR